MKPAYKYKYIYKYIKAKNQKLHLSLVWTWPGGGVWLWLGILGREPTQGDNLYTRDNTRGGTEYKDQYRDLYYAGDESQGRG